MSEEKDKSKLWLERQKEVDEKMRELGWEIPEDNSEEEKVESSE